MLKLVNKIKTRILEKNKIGNTLIKIINVIEVINIQSKIQLGVIAIETGVRLQNKIFLSGILWISNKNLDEIYVIFEK